MDIPASFDGPAYYLISEGKLYAIFKKYWPEEIQVIESLEKHRSFIFSITLDGSKGVEFTFLSHVDRGAYHMKVYADRELISSDFTAFPPGIKSLFQKSKPVRFNFCRFQ